MNSEALVVWLLAQAFIELLLCGSILYLLYRGRSTKEEVSIEVEKLRKLVLSFDRVFHRHHTLSDLWEKAEEKGAALEACMNGYGRRHKNAGRINGIRNQPPGRTGISSYEKTARLLEKGVPVGEIAEQVGLPRGEVELIMNLRRH